MDSTVKNEIFNCRTFVAVVVAGIVIGLAAAILRWMVGCMTRLVMTDFDVKGGNWWMIPSAVIGIVLTAWLVRKVFKVKLDDSTTRLKADMASGSCCLPLKLVFAPIITCSVTLGFGGSAGAEGPIVYSGAAIASNVARYFRLSREQMMLFMACGAGAGIAAIFRAPVGGFFFVVEMLRLPLGYVSATVLAVMCLAAGLTTYSFADFAPDLSVYMPALFSIGMLPLLLLLGAVGGLYSVYYMDSGEYVCRKLHSVNRPILQNLYSGLLLGLLLFLFPALYGEGYNILDGLAVGKPSSALVGSLIAAFTSHYMAVVAVVGVLLVKAFATYATNSGGGVAGDYAPTLFAGGVLGCLLSLAVPLFPGSLAVPSEMLVVCGMAAVMSGVVRAPLMSIFISVEMTSSPGLLLPVVIASSVSYFVSRSVKQIGA